MFGYFRFILALMVVASHSQVTVQGVNFGVSAVVVFYILAGYVTSNLFEKVFINTQNPLKNYFYDRFLRIFPLYIYIYINNFIFVFNTIRTANFFSNKDHKQYSDYSIKLWRDIIG